MKNRFVVLILVVASCCVLLFFFFKIGKDDGELTRVENIGQQEVSPITTETTADIAFVHSDEHRRRMARDAQLLSPVHDGWASEAVAAEAQTQLKALIKAVILGGNGSSRIANHVEATEIRPANLKTVHEDEMIRIDRLSTTERLPVARRSGKEFLAQLKGAFALDLPDAAPHKHVKITSVELDGLNNAMTRALVELSQGANGDSWQSNAEWNCKWIKDNHGKLLLSGLTVERHVEVRIRNKPGRWFQEKTSAVIGASDAFANQFYRGHHYWLQRIEQSHRFDTSVRNGLAIGDVNGDGLDDIYICQPPGLPNRLFLHQNDGTAVDISETAGVDWLDQTSSAIFCDLDNDGDQDLTIGTPVGLLVMRNDGGGRFELVQDLKTDYDVQSISAVDYNNDGHLDLFACVYRTSNPTAAQQFLYRDAVGGGMNRLFRNDSSQQPWTFSMLRRVVV